MSYTVGVNDNESVTTENLTETQLDFNNDSDDFDDFQEAIPLVDDEKTNISISQSSSFNERESPKSLSSITQAISSAQCLTTSLPSLDTIVNQSFTKARSDENDKTNNSITSNLFNDKTSQSYKIWENLLNLEESTSFRLNWKSSHTFQVFLASLKIDKKNIIDNFFVNTPESSPESEGLKMSTPPLLEANIEILNPISDEIPGSSSPLTTSPSSSSSSTASSVSSQPISNSSATTNSSNTKLPSSDESTQLSQVSQKLQSLDVTPTENKNSSASSIPKANIDLNSTGLSNPSDEIHSSNNLLDVTFFLNNPNFMQPCSSPKATVKVNDSDTALSSLQNNELSTKPLSIISSASTDPFHSLISHIQDASSMRSTHKPQSPITPSESKIFEELPLLSFMRTKLLMFPLRDSIKE